MCGIAGIVNLSGEAVDTSLIEKMTHIIAHRGPDGSGIYRDKNIALGHRRLSVIDLSEASAQPMIFNDQYVIVYNGEIYNYLEIRTELSKKGYQFQTTGDTEVILAAYDCWKQECVQKFNGMWAFCIYDKKRNSLFCSRDRFGVKPFYYSISGNEFRFGSEIRQFLNSDFKAKVNTEIVSNYLILGLEEYDEQTFFDGIKKLLPSHNLSFDLNTGTLSISRYYEIQINEELEKIELEEATDLYLNELKRSVSYRLRSDIQVGTCLSGGLDSSMIAALASEIYHHSSPSKFTAITAGSVQASNDETAYAKEVVDKSQLNWLLTTPSKSDFINSISEVIQTQEEPFGSPSVFMQYFVMKKAKEAGCPVLLDGQGGDETLLGYSRYYPSYLLSLKGIDRIRGLFSSASNSGNSLMQILKSYFYFTNSNLRIKRQLNRSQFLNNDFKRLINTSLVDRMAAYYGNIRDMQLLELTTTQLPHLLKYEDKNSMHFSIETRLPFLDYKMVELSLSLNNAFKIRNGYSKYILRKASENILPASISWRKNKIGFEAPSALWLDDNNYLNTTIKKSAILRAVSNNIPDLSNDKILQWRLFNIAKWEEVFNVT